ncbi:hypothetical protein FIBSPDRAFT_1045278 [Athelia psychrophila]|uniref:Uncharacterized protein n=1 Tax=Athelia psychrophila TaxID=1759441 RepID=A0A166IIX4_9AGAM|nr:hypothetical protein FIBSPDRAFT_1045278 [Fibularhizoctonia sp. CBS 109695]
MKERPYISYDLAPTHPDALVRIHPRRSPTPPHTAPPAPHSDSLPARHGYDSSSELVLPFKSNAALLDSYTIASGGIRVGQLMEHPDSLAWSIAYKHLLGSTVAAVGTVHERIGAVQRHPRLAGVSNSPKDVEFVQGSVRYAPEARASILTSQTSTSEPAAIVA